jgi:hypothetical protein
MIEHSESLASLAPALAKAQGEVENAAKNAKNPHFRSSYADLAEIINTVRPVLSKHGLAVVQIPGYADGVVTVDTMLTHASGEWIMGQSAAPVAKADPQGVGSACTYLRRYSLAALCGIAQEDDDGNAASSGNGASKPARASNGGGKATPKQLEYLDNLMKSSVFTDAERDRVGAKIASGDRETVSAAIEWCKGEMDARKAVPA